MFYIYEEQSGNHLIQMLFVSVFAFLLLVLKAFLFRYSISLSATVFDHLRGQLQVRVIVLGCVIPDARYNTLP